MQPPTALPTRPAERRLAGIALRVAGISCFAIMAAAIKLAADRGVSTVELIFARNLFSVPVVLAWLLAGPGLRAVRTSRPGAHLGRAAIGLISMALNFQALIMLPLAEATTIGFSAPLFATIFSALLLAEPVGRHRWAAVLLGFAGVLVVMQPGGAPVTPAGLAVAVAAAIGVAGVNVAIRQIGATEGVAATVFWFNLACLAAAGSVMPFFAQPHDMQAWALMVGIGVSGGCAQICFTGSLRLAPVAVVVPFDYVQLLWAIGLGWAIWATQPSAHTLAGAALIVASGLYTVWREHRLRRDHVPATPPAL